MLTIKEAAAEIGVYPATLRKWADRGLIPVTRLPSGYRRWTRQQIDEIKAGMRRRLADDR